MLSRQPFFSAFSGCAASVGECKYIQVPRDLRYLLEELSEKLDDEANAGRISLERRESAKAAIYAYASSIQSASSIQATSSMQTPKTPRYATIFAGMRSLLTARRPTKLIESGNDFFGCTYRDLMNPSDAVGYVKALHQIFEIVRPFPCGLDLIRIGGAGDGAYLLPNDFDGLAACYSPGTANSKDFEDELATRFGVRSHMCDYSSDKALLKTPLIKGMQTFRKCWLEPFDHENGINLAKWVSEESPNAAEDLLLQMDIEGAEYRNILNCAPDLLKRFRIILIELHGLDYLLNTGVTIDVLKPFFDKLDEFFLCVHAHPNNCCGAVKIPELAVNMPRSIRANFS